MWAKDSPPAGDYEGECAMIDTEPINTNANDELAQKMRRDTELFLSGHVADSPKQIAWPSILSARQLFTRKASSNDPRPRNHSRAA